MTKLKTSIAMASYNGEAFIGEQLESIASQSLPPDELVICDDLSDDGTLGIAQEFARRSAFPVRVECNSTRLGYIRNFRKATSRCSGDLIFFADQDDWWAQDKLKAVAAHFEDPKVLMVYHNALVVDRDRRRIGSLYSADEETSALAISPIAPWHHSYGLVQAFRSSLRQFDTLWDLSKNHITDPVDILSHDQWYFFLAQVLGEVRFIDDHLVQYRQHGRNTVGAFVRRPMLANRLGARLIHFGRQDERLAEAAQARVRVLHALIKIAPEYIDAATRIAGCYEVYASRLIRRAATYSLPSPRERFQQLLVAIGRGDYSGWPWGFDGRSIVRDLWSGVILNRMEEPG